MREIRKVMLGHLASDVSVVIITPLKSTYKKLREKLIIEETYETAFFENCVVKVEGSNKKGLIVLSPQGVFSKDIIELFTNVDILFFGLAGSLNKKIKIGSFVEAKSAVFEKENINLITTGRHDIVKCGYSPCLIGKLAKKYCNLAKTMNCDVVDMETSYCAKTAIENNNRFTSLLLISDIPNVINFWEVSLEYQNQVKKSRAMAVDKTLNYINRLLRKE